MEKLVRHRQTKETETDRLLLYATAPAPDPTIALSAQERSTAIASTVPRLEKKGVTQGGDCLTLSC